MHQNEVMRQQIVELDRQIQEEEAANRQIRLEIDSLKTDPKTVERLAREQLGLARPDETVVRFGIPGESVHGHPLGQAPGRNWFFLNPSL